MDKKSCTDCYETDLMKCAACARNSKGVEIDPVKKTMPDIKKPLFNIAHGMTFKAEPQTNADRVRAMSDEELAKFICSHLKCNTCDFAGWVCSLRDWLKQPAEEGDHE